MFNPFKRLKALLPDPPLQVGEVLSFSDGVATIEVPGGGISQARGDTTVGAKVFFRDALIEGPAPNLPVEVIEI
jgi:hypothetical protein